MLNLLLTGTIDTSVFVVEGPNKNLAIKDTDTRLRQYKNAIEFYIQNSLFDNIVFAENSNYNKFDCKYYENLALQNNKKFEYITFNGDAKMTNQRGKSYGEAEIIEKAILCSKLFEEEETIYKITGRVICKNINKIVKTHNNVPNEFVRFRSMDWVKTVIFKISKSDFINYFSGAKDLCDETLKPQMPIEKVYFDIINKYDCIIAKPFKIYPDLDGVSGSSGTTYKKSALRLLYADLAIILGLLSPKSKKYSKK